MVDIKLFKITGTELPNSSYKGDNIRVSGNCNNELYAGLQQHKKLIDLSSKTGHRVIEILLGLIGVSSDKNQIKKIGNVAIQVRKLLKDIDPIILDDIDKISFIVPFIYLFLGFNTHDISHHGKGGLNSMESFAKTIQILIHTECILFSGFLCAQRNHENIEKDGLVENVNLLRFIQGVNLLRGIAENLNKPYAIEFSHVQGDAYGMNAVFPTIFMKYFSEGKLNQMSKTLYSQFHQMQEGAGSNVKILSVSDHFAGTTQTLIERYGSTWGTITDFDLETLAKSGDKVAEIAYYMTLPSMKRFGDLMQVLEENYPDSIKSQWITDNVSQLGGAEHISPAIDMFFESKNIYGKALYETVFYYNWGIDVKNKNGIGVGFDRDHDIYQTSAFALGYDGRVPNLYNPLLYARRTGKQPGTDIKDLTFRQFWFHEGNDIPD